MLRKAIDEQRDDRELGLLLAKSLTLQSQYVETQAVLERRLEKDPADDECRQMLISCQMSHSSQLRSERHFQQSLDLLEEAQQHQEALLSKSQSAEHLHRLSIIHGTKEIVLLSLGAHEKASEERERATDLIDELLKQFPSNSNYQKTAVTYRLNRAMRLRDQGKYGEAESEFRSVMKMQLDLAQANPAVPKHRMRLGQIQINLCRLLIEENQLVDAERTALEAISGWTFLVEFFGIEYLTGLASSKMQLARIYAALEKYEDAIATITLAINHTEEAREKLGLLVFIHENMLRTYGYRADWLMALGRYSEAASDYREIIQIEDSAWNRGRLGVAYYGAGKFDQAIEQHQKADGMLAGGDRAHRMFYAMALQQLGRTNEALQRYVEGAAWIIANGKGGEQIRFRGEAEQLLGIDAKRREELVTTYYSDPPPADVTVDYWRSRALWHSDHGNDEQSVADWTHAIQLGPNDGESYRQRARALIELKRWDAAISDVADAIRLSPGPWAYIERCKAYQGLGQLDLAAADAEQAVALDDGNRWAWHQLGQVCSKLKNWTRAAEVYQRLLEFEPNGSGYWLKYTNALVASGQLSKYREFCAELLERHGLTDDPKIASEFTHRLLLGPDAVDDWSLPLKLSQLVLNSGSGKHWVKIHVSELLCRAGEYERSLELRAEAIAQAGREPHGWDCFWQAMAHHGLGNIDQARDLASKARELADSDRLAQTTTTYSR